MKFRNKKNSGIVYRHIPDHFDHCTHIKIIIITSSEIIFLYAVPLGTIGTCLGAL
jgi:hypothetical protein